MTGAIDFLLFNGPGRWGSKWQKMCFHGATRACVIVSSSWRHLWPDFWPFQDPRRVIRCTALRRRWTVDWSINTTALYNSRVGSLPYTYACEYVFKVRHPQYTNRPTFSLKEITSRRIRLFSTWIEQSRMKCNPGILWFLVKVIFMFIFCCMLKGYICFMFVKFVFVISSFRVRLINNTIQFIASMIRTR